MSKTTPNVQAGTAEDQKEFSPFILCIACNWCTYAGTDQAGTSRMQRPANVRIMRVMCSGRVDPQMVLEALKRGADGVLIGACHIGDCHYVNGNYKTVRRMPVLVNMVKQYGFNPERVKLRHISASEGAEFTELIHEYVEELKELGPNPIKKEWEACAAANANKANETKTKTTEAKAKATEEKAKQTEVKEKPAETKSKKAETKKK